MDFSDSADEAAFRVTVRRWLESNAAEYKAVPKLPYEEAELVARGRAWQRLKSESSFAGIALPRSVGGRAGSPMQDLIFDHEERQYHVPTGPFVHVGVRMTVPAILTHGSPDLVRRFAQPTLRGDVLWCQLYSEPSAGSDLAAVRTKAMRDGSNWVVNGQKVWTSWAHHADRGLLLARSDGAVPKHKGLSFFLLDMKTPGVDVRPIRQINGKSEFNEVFLTDVVIPDSDRLGNVGDGWKVAMTTLMSERMIADEAGESITFSDIFGRALRSKRNGRPAIEDNAVCERLARWYAQGKGLEYYRYRLMTLMSKGGVPGPEVALAKLVFSTKVQEMAAFAMELDDSAGVFAGPLNTQQRQSFEAYMFAVTMRIAGGTDEILRNQIAERVLGLPGEPRVDKDVPFNQLT